MVADLDECDFNEHTCDREFGQCINVEGSYTCECRPGFTGDGRNCIQRDECQTPDHECATSAKCIDTVGSYTCQCEEGFRGDGKVCTGRTKFCPTVNMKILTALIFEKPLTVP